MQNNKKEFQLVPFIIAIALPLAVGGLGSVLTVASVKTWYLTINKPAFNPPNYLFGPVWTTLFILMGIASYLVWQKRKTISNYPTVVGVYILQLLLNLTWSFLFFYSQQIGLALAEIVILLAVIITNAILFGKVNKVAGWLFLPYILWVSFATFLNYSIYIIN
jgi:translocator protein